jgi:hypothetical protein
VAHFSHEPRIRSNRIFDERRSPGASPVPATPAPFADEWLGCALV